MPKEIPYSKINPRELKDLEAEFGKKLTPELAQCLIRYRMNRDAIDLMLRKEAAQEASDPLSRMELSEIAPAKRKALKRERVAKLSGHTGPRRATRRVVPGITARRHKTRHASPKPVLAIHAQDAGHPLH